MKMIGTALRLAVRALLAYKIRSLLTMLGIIIGIGAVIVMISIGRGANASIQDSINKMGSNMLMIFSGSSKKGGVRGGSGSRPTLKVKDAEAIARECPAVRDVTYVISRNIQIVSGKTNWGTKVYGTTPEYTLVRDWPMREGEFISARHLRAASSVVVLGASVAENLFEQGEEIIGQKIRINNFPFRIIGITNKKGSTSYGNDQDDVVFIPYTTVMRRLMGRRLPGLVYFIGVSAQTKSLVNEAKREIEELLRQRHRILPDADDDFTIRSLDEFASMASKTSGTMTLLLTAVAGVSLLVGGIGIMNIMLVSVTERTREIGLRLALGARRRDISRLFLIEALLICLLGGVLGVVLGVAASWLIARLAGWPILIAPETFVAALTFSGAVGLIFGYYPARKAAGLLPATALRSE